MSLTWLLWFAIVAPVVVHLHELGHAAAALRLTRDSVVVQGCVGTVGAVGLGRLQVAIGLPSFSGVCFHADAPGRFGNAAIAAAGPLVSLVTGVVAAWAWVSGSGGTPLAAFAVASLFTAVANLIPCELGSAGAFAPQETDGRVILRALGLVTPRRRAAPPPVIRAPFAIVLAAVAVAAAVISPPLLLVLAATFGVAWVQTSRSLRSGE
jgi:hypothetical protein